MHETTAAVRALLPADAAELLDRLDTANGALEVADQDLLIEIVAGYFPGLAPAIRSIASGVADRRLRRGLGC